MKIQIGLVQHSIVWEQLCLQEGVPYKEISLSRGSLNEQCSVLVVNRVLARAELESVEQYVREGGAVLGCAHHISGMPGLSSSSARLDYIVSDHDSTFPDISIMDLGLVGAIPKEANALRTQLNTFALFAGPLGKGYIVALPFEVEQTLRDVRVANKNFYAKVERLPAERVSLVNKGEIRYLLHKAFEYLHHVRGIWYAHLWYYPADNANVFAFRVDTDRSKREEVDALYSIARQHECPLSWFLDVKSHESWLKHFQSLVDQEFGVHCYEHEVFPTLDMNLRNILKAMREMQSVGLHPTGFAAPYGVWSEYLAQALEQIGFAYSSEFSYAYDTLPLFPLVSTKKSTVVQIPIHPICIGSMLRVGYSNAQMIEYFRMVIDFKWLRNEPLIFYHHPIHRKWEVTEFIFEHARQYPVQNVTLGEYARWWKQREGKGVVIEYENDHISIEADPSSQDAGSSDVWLRVSSPAGEYAIVPAQGRIDRTTSSLWKRCPAPVSPPGDVRRIREFDLRTTLGDLYTTLTRKSG